MEGLQQLEHEIQRHLAMARLCSGPIHEGHLEAARQLAALREYIRGETCELKLDGKRPSPRQDATGSNPPWATISPEP